MFVELREQRSSGAIRRGITGRSKTKVWPLFVLARKSGNIFDPYKHEEEAKRFFLKLNRRDYTYEVIIICNSML